MTKEITLSIIKEALGKEMSAIRDLGLDDMSEEFYPSIPVKYIKWLVERLENLNKTYGELFSREVEILEENESLRAKVEELSKMVKETAVSGFESSVRQGDVIAELQARIKKLEAAIKKVIEANNGNTDTVEEAVINGIKLGHSIKDLDKALSECEDS